MALFLNSYVLNSYVEFACLVVYYTVVFLGVGHFTTIFVTCLLFTPFYPLTLVYLTWMLLDLKSPCRGGRDCGSYFMRRLTIFNYVRDYFPISLTKTAELDPGKNYVFGYHPHGILTDGAVICFATEAVEFSKRFPGIVPHLAAHKMLFYSFIIRDILMSLGGINVSRDGLEHVLTKKGPGHSAVIIVGGAAEMLENEPGTYNLILKNRKGFIRLALETGAHLVPVIGFGQNDTHPALGNKRGTWTGDVMRQVQKTLGKFGPCLCYGLFGWLVCRRSPIRVVVGAPIPVEKVVTASENQVNELHTRYLEKLKQLFQENRRRYQVPDTAELQFF